MQLFFNIIRQNSSLYTCVFIGNLLQFPLIFTTR